MATLLNQLLRNLREISLPKETARSVADQLGIGREHLSKLERGALGRPTPELLEKMLELYGASDSTKELFRELLMAAKAGTVPSQLPQELLSSIVTKLHADTLLKRRYLVRSSLFSVLETKRPQDQFIITPEATFEAIFSDTTNWGAIRLMRIAQLNRGHLLFLDYERNAPELEKFSKYPTSVVLVGGLVMHDYANPLSIPDADEFRIHGFNFSFTRAFINCTSEEDTKCAVAFIDALARLKSRYGIEFADALKTAGENKSPFGKKRGQRPAD